MQAKFTPLAIKLQKLEPSHIIFQNNKLYKASLRCHFTMTAENKSPPYESKKMQLLEEVCENTRAIRRVTNRILDHLHEYQTGVSGYDEPKEEPDEWSWDDLDSHDDMYL